MTCAAFATIPLTIFAGISLLELVVNVLFVGKTTQVFDRWYNTSFVLVFAAFMAVEFVIESYAFYCIMRLVDKDKAHVWIFLNVVIVIDIVVLMIDRSHIFFYALCGLIVFRDLIKISIYKAYSNKHVWDETEEQQEKE